MRMALSVVFSSNLNGTPELVVRLLNRIDRNGLSMQENIFGYVFRRDVEGVKRILAERRGSIYDVYGEELQSPLAAAVMNRDIAMVPLLLQAGADPYQEVWAAGNSTSGVPVTSMALKFLVAGQAYGTELSHILPIVQQFDDEDRPVLHMAITGLLHLDIRETLLNPEHLADVNRTAMGGLSPLHLAAIRGDTGIIRLLLRAGADIDLVTLPTSSTALHQACGYSQYEAAKVLVEAGAKVNEKDKYGQTPLSCVAAWVRSDKIGSRLTSLLAEHGADLNVQSGSCSATPLLLATSHGSLGCVKSLVAHGCDINYRDNDGDTALCGAIYYRNHEIAQFLLDIGASILLVNHQSRGILHALALAGDVRMLDIFTRARMQGLDTAAKDLAGKTPLAIFEERNPSPELYKAFKCLLDSVDGLGKYEADGESNGDGDLDGDSDQDSAEFVDAREEPGWED